MKLHPRFSIRTLAVLLTLVCLYFGSWSSTDRFGVPAINSQPDERVHSPMPFIVLVDSVGWVEEIRPSLMTATLKRDWHLWFFGIMLELPYESTWSAG